jgi:hypothetical protein
MALLSFILRSPILSDPSWDYVLSTRGSYMNKNDHGEDGIHPQSKFIVKTDEIMKCKYPSWPSSDSLYKQECLLQIFSIFL